MYISRLARVAERLKLPRLWALCRLRLASAVESANCVRRVFRRAFVLGAAARSLLALDSRRFEFIALLPSYELGEACRFPAEREAESRHRAIADKIHLRMVFITRLVITLLGVLFVLRQTPGFVVPFELHAFVDRECGNADAGQTEMIGAVKMSCFGAGVRTNGQPELFSHRLHPRIEGRALRA